MSEKQNDISDLKHEDINTDNIDLHSLNETLLKIKKDIKSINKNSQISVISINLLKEELSSNNEQIFRLKKELEKKQFDEIKIYKKILIILDQLDNIYKFASLIDNEDLIKNLNMIRKIIRKEIEEINLCEINSVDELFNPNVHRCIGIEENNLKQHNEIISVTETGYILNGKVLRPASVIISK